MDCHRVVVLGSFFITKKMHTHQGDTVQWYMKRANISFPFLGITWFNSFGTCFSTEKMYN